MTTDRRLYDMDLGRRENTRWLGSNRYAGGAPPLTLPTANLLAAYDARVGVTDVSGACSAWAAEGGILWAPTPTSPSATALTAPMATASYATSSDGDRVVTASVRIAGTSTPTGTVVVTVPLPAGYSCDALTTGCAQGDPGTGTQTLAALAVNGASLTFTFAGAAATAFSFWAVFQYNSSPA